MGFETGKGASQWVVINANDDVSSSNNTNTWGLAAIVQGAPLAANGAVYLGKVADRTSIVLYDANGRLVVNKEVFNTKKYSMNMSDYAKGLYTVVINTDGSQSVHKLSKQ